MKISVIGYSGSGKSTFSSKLSTYYNIEAYYLDKLFFNPNWQQVDPEIFKSRVNNIITLDKWITDGNYSRYSVDRIANSDLIFIFNFNRIRCLFNIIKRRIKYHKKIRESSAEGCYEKLDFGFIKFVLFDSRTKARRKYYKDILSTYPNKAIQFKKHKDVNDYFNSLTVDSI